MRATLSMETNTTIAGRTASRFEDDLVGALDAHDRLSAVWPALNTREQQTFYARADLGEQTTGTDNATARSAVRNARRRLATT